MKFSYTFFVVIYVDVTTDIYSVINTRGFNTYLIPYDARGLSRLWREGWVSQEKEESGEDVEKRNESEVWHEQWFENKLFLKPFSFLFELNDMLVYHYSLRCLKQTTST